MSGVISTEMGLILGIYFYVSPSGDAAVELEIGTQMSSARRGIATEEMKQVAKDEDIDFNFLVQRVANGSIIIPKNSIFLYKKCAKSLSDHRNVRWCFFLLMASAISVSAECSSIGNTRNSVMDVEEKINPTQYQY